VFTTQKMFKVVAAMAVCS